MCCLPSRAEAYDGRARADERPPPRPCRRGASAGRKGASTKDYPGYDRMIAQVSQETFEDQIAKGVGLVGTAKDVIDMARAYANDVGGLESASLHIVPSTMPVDVAERAMRHFAAEAMPHLAAL